ncbi:MAG: extracellular solute-binding protein [Blautia sp.]|nr:extracellular solute-binding protein [Blautia sp.]
MKKMMAMLLAAGMVFGLTGAASAEEVTEVTLKVWTPQEDQADADSWLQQMEAKFEEEHPEYKMTWVNEVCGEDVARDQVTKDPAAAADVYMFANDQLGTLISANAIAKLGGAYLDQVMADNSESMIASVSTADGSVYGFPNAANTWFCYYNKDVYTEEDVTSLETMLEKGVVAFQSKGGWYNGAFFFANGAEAYGPNGNDLEAKINFGQDGGVAALNTMIEIFNHPNFRTDADGLGYSGMQSGEVSAYFSGSWEYEGLKEALGDKLGACQPPTAVIDGEAKTLKSFAGSKAIAVNPNCAVPKAAMQFAASLASVDGQKLRYDLRSAIPVATSLAEDPAIAEDIVAVAIMNTVANASVLQPVQGMDQWWSNMETLGSNIINGSVTADNAEESLAQTLELINDTGL